MELKKIDFIIQFWMNKRCLCSNCVSNHNLPSSSEMLKSQNEYDQRLNTISIPNVSLHSSQLQEEIIQFDLPNLSFEKKEQVNQKNRTPTNLADPYEVLNLCGEINNAVIQNQQNVSAGLIIQEAIANHQDQDDMEQEIQIQIEQRQQIIRVHVQNDQSLSQTAPIQAPARVARNDYRKNICGNMFKTAIKKMMSPQFQKFAKKRCKNRFTYEQLKDYVDSRGKSLYGPNKLILTFKEDKVSFEIFKIFAKLLMDILRKNYMKEVLVAGQMKDKKQYIDYKNKFMLYFEDLQ